LITPEIHLPYVTHRGQRIHYTVEGAGPLVVLQHGFLSNANESWKQPGFVDALTDRFTVAYVDSLGHGLSDKPADQDLYAQKQRAGDLVAVMDDLGSERAHLIGYSMGGWMSVGVAKHYPERLASLTVGGWDLVEGAMTARLPGADRVLTFDELMMFARARASVLVEWVTPEVEPGLRAAWNALGELDATEEKAVLSAGVPVLLWNGGDDPYHDPMQAFGIKHGLRFLSTPGDHLSAIQVHGKEAANGLRTFLESQ
jgi:pimeloyl-ACP methyl ester carboxylesterase